jgi:hypothetical protein
MIAGGFHDDDAVAARQIENVRLFLMAADVHALLATVDRGVEHEVRLTEEDAARRVEHAIDYGRLRPTERIDPLLCNPEGDQK